MGFNDHGEVGGFIRSVLDWWAASILVSSIICNLKVTLKEDKQGKC